MSQCVYISYIGAPKLILVEIAQALNTLDVVLLTVVLAKYIYIYLAEFCSCSS